MVMAALTAGGKNPKVDTEPKKKKKEKKKEVDLTLETGPGDVGPSAYQGTMAELPPQAGMQYVGPGGGAKPFDVTLNQLLNMPPGTDVAGAIGQQTPPQIGVQGDTGQAQVVSGQPGQQQFQPMDVEPYPEMGFGKKLAMGLMGAVPFLNIAAYPFWKQHQEKVAGMQAQDERTGDWFFGVMEEQPQAAQKLLSTPFVREALTRRYGIDTPEELQSLQQYAQSVGIPLSQAAAGLATGKLTPAVAPTGAGIGEVGVGPDQGLTGAGLMPPTAGPPTPGALPSALGYLQPTPQVLGRGDRFVSPTTGQVLTTSQIEEQQNEFLKDYKKANPDKTDLDGWLQYMYAYKGQVPFETTSGGNRVVITDRITGKETVIDGISLDKGNVAVEEIWDGNEFLGWLLIDRDDMTNQEIWLEDVMKGMPEEQVGDFKLDLIKWARDNLPKQMADVVISIWDAGGRVAGQRKSILERMPKGKGKGKGKPTTTTTQPQEKDMYDKLLEGE